jgi:glycerol-3-phosphate dehydrogenase
MADSDVSARRHRRLRALGAGYDVVVVGAGVNGAGIAWDAALRGLRVLLVDKGDVGSGTSSWSSRMIHGGLKYLEKYDVPLVRESLREREWLLRSAPHLVHELRFLLPFYEQSKHAARTLKLGMLAYDVLSFDKSVRRFELLSREEILAREPGLDPAGLSGAAAYSDAQVDYAERLSYEIALAAQGAGAHLLTYLRAVDLGRAGGQVTSVTLRDELTGDTYEAPARAVVNAAGPWVDEVWAASDLPLPRMTGGTKGTHLIVDPFPGAPRDAFYYEAVTDGRPMMVIPWLGRYLLGSTDVRFGGDLDTVSADREEYDYILGETNRVIPAASLTVADVRYAYTGVRPLPYAEGGDVADITRRHEIVHHAPQVRGLYTLVGGKLTTFRQVGEEVADRLCRYLGVRRRSVTRRLALPGGGDPRLDRLRRQVGRSGLPERLVRRLVNQYGTRGPDVAALITADAANREMLDDGFQLTAGEVAWAVTQEDAQRVADVLARRTMIGLENDLGLGVLERVAERCQQLLGWDDARRDAEIASYLHYITRFQPEGSTLR